jgi:hypothetical protein
MIAAPIAKPEGKTNSTAFVVGRSFMIGVISLVVVGIVHARGRNPTTGGTFLLPLSMTFALDQPERQYRVSGAPCAAQ